MFGRKAKSEINAYPRLDLLTWPRTKDIEIKLTPNCYYSTKLLPTAYNNEPRHGEQPPKDEKLKIFSLFEVTLTHTYMLSM